MDHFEDRIVLAQKNPIHWIDDMLAGRVQWSRKWDGAPAIFLGRDEKGLYIAKKSIFNKNSKLYYTAEISLSNIVILPVQIFCNFT